MAGHFALNFPVTNAKMAVSASFTLAELTSVYLAALVGPDNRKMAGTIRLVCVFRGNKCSYIAYRSGIRTVSTPSWISIFPRALSYLEFGVKLKTISDPLSAKRLWRHLDDRAKADVFDNIECFYNPKRRHSTTGYLSPWSSRCRWDSLGRVSTRPVAG